MYTDEELRAYRASLSAAGSVASSPILRELPQPAAGNTVYLQSLVVAAQAFLECRTDRSSPMQPLPNLSPGLNSSPSWKPDPNNSALERFLIWSMTSS